jgi:hypothetical protein
MTNDNTHVEVVGPVANSSPPSIWQSKPWWCQPWTIVLTGLLAISMSWLVLHKLWFTALIGFVVLVWWWLFLVLVPGLDRQAQASNLG